MDLPYINERTHDALPIESLDSAELEQWRESATADQNAWLDMARFRASPGSHCVIPNAEGKPARVLAGRSKDDWLWSIAGLSSALGPVDCYLDTPTTPQNQHLAALGFALGAYRFTRYGKAPLEPARLALGDGIARDVLEAEVRAIHLTRDLINTPAADMMPEHLSQAMQTLAARHGAAFNEVVGDDLLSNNYPSIHAVGRASAHPPRLLELTWGAPDLPEVVLVGKGVCFDSGGLDIKPAAGMRFMKKDMGGAAHALGTASRIMDMATPVHLRVLIPAVENAISGDAFRPGDVLSTRAGITVEIDNTDAEGRLVLSDALTRACEGSPKAIIDFATLTGAARVALGTSLPAMFCNDDALALSLADSGAVHADPVWRMPLHAPYKELLDSRIADLVNSAGGPYAGAITAALFLEHFVSPGTPWAHFDIMAWNQRSRSGRPEGGEAMALRAVASTIDKLAAEK